MKQRFLAGLIFLLIFLGAYSLLSHAYPTKYWSLTIREKTPNTSTQEIEELPPSKLGGVEVLQEKEDEGILVTRVIDGDTVELETGQKVRYIGIDTPETSDPRTGVECFGKEAAAKNRNLVEGKRVRLEKDVSETDKYSRLLRYVFVPSSSSGQAVFVNEVLVKEGYAFSSTYPPDVKYQDLFTKAEKSAREADRGLWGSCGFIAGTKTTKPETDCVIKGNISRSGEKIYHLPGQRYYNKTVVSESKNERWFCTEEGAKDAGWRKSKI